MDTIGIIICVAALLVAAASLVGVIYAMRRMASQSQQLEAQLERRQQEQERRNELLMENAGARALRDQGATLRQQNLQQLGEAIAPLKSRLEDFSRAVNESYVRENAARRSLADQVERLMMLNMSIGEEARNLTQALKGDSKVQGDWGETLLSRILEQAGLCENRDFTTQYSRNADGTSLRDEEGRLLRPDVVVALPGDRCVIIDSKVSLTAFAAYMEASGEDEKASAMKRHLQSVRKHIDELAAKRYQKTVKGAMEHVLMFIPNEGAFLLAVQGDAELCGYAVGKGVALVSAPHLMSVMQLVAQLWRREKQDRNAAEIARLGGLLYDKIAAFTVDFEAVMRGLRQTEAAYDRCMKDLAAGSTSVMARAGRLRDLGAKSTRTVSLAVSEATDLFIRKSPAKEPDVDQTDDPVADYGEKAG